MPSKVKVSSWLDKQDTHDSGSESGAETDEDEEVENGGSGSESGGATDEEDQGKDGVDAGHAGGSKPAKKQASFSPRDQSDDEDDEQAEEVSWDSRISSLRRVLIDRSEPKKVSALEEDWRISDDRAYRQPIFRGSITMH
jgi:hypothetical protein